MKALSMMDAFRIMGPAFLVSVALVDPGNWATAIEAGSRFGYELVWVVVASNLIAILLQTLAARLGIVTGKHLAQVCRESYPPQVCALLWVLCEISIVALDLTMLLGTAIGLNMLLGWPLLPCILMTSLDALLLLLLVPAQGVKKSEVLTVGLLAVVVACFLVDLLVSRPPLRAVVGGLLPRLRRDSVYTAVSLLGANVMPHNFYLHSALVSGQGQAAAAAAAAAAGGVGPTAGGLAGGASYGQIRALCMYNFLDIGAALGVALVINVAVLLVSAATFHSAGVLVHTLQAAHDLMEQTLSSSIAPAAFGTALLCAGQLSTFTGTIAGQVVLQGFLNIHISTWLRRLVTRTAAIIPAAILQYVYGDRGTYKFLLIAQVVLALQLPVTLVPLIKATSSRKLMGPHASSRLMAAAAWSATGLVFLANLMLFVTQMLPQVSTSGRGILDKDGPLDVWIDRIAELAYRDPLRAAGLLSLLVAASAFLALQLWMIVTPLRVEGGGAAAAAAAAAAATGDAVMFVHTDAASAAAPGEEKVAGGSSWQGTHGRGAGGAAAAAQQHMHGSGRSAGDGRSCAGGYHHYQRRAAGGNAAAVAAAATAAAATSPLTADHDRSNAGVSSGGGGGGVGRVGVPPGQQDGLRRAGSSDMSGLEADPFAAAAIAAARAAATGGGWVIPLSAIRMAILPGLRRCGSGAIVAGLESEAAVPLPLPWYPRQRRLRRRRHGGGGGDASSDDLFDSDASSWAEVSCSEYGSEYGSDGDDGADAGVPVDAAAVGSVGSSEMRLVALALPSTPLLTTPASRHSAGAALLSHTDAEGTGLSASTGPGASTGDCGSVSVSGLSGNSDLLASSHDSGWPTAALLTAADTGNRSADRNMGCSSSSRSLSVDLFAPDADARRMPSVEGIAPGVGGSSRATSSCRLTPNASRADLMAVVDDELSPPLPPLQQQLDGASPLSMAAAASAAATPVAAVAAEPQSEVASCIMPDASIDAVTIATGLGASPSEAAAAAAAATGAPIATRPTHPVTRGCRRQFASLLDDFWSAFYDTHGVAVGTAEAVSRRGSSAGRHGPAKRQQRELRSQQPSAEPETLSGGAVPGAGASTSGPQEPGGRAGTVAGGGSGGGGGAVAGGARRGPEGAAGAAPGSRSPSPLVCAHTDGSHLCMGCSQALFLSVRSCLLELERLEGVEGAMWGQWPLQLLLPLDNQTYHFHRAVLLAARNADFAALQALCHGTYSSTVDRSKLLASTPITAAAASPAGPSAPMSPHTSVQLSAPPGTASAVAAASAQSSSTSSSRTGQGQHQRHLQQPVVPRRHPSQAEAQQQPHHHHHHHQHTCPDPPAMLQQQHPAAAGGVLSRAAVGGGEKRTWWGASANAAHGGGPAPTPPTEGNIVSAAAAPMGGMRQPASLPPTPQARQPPSPPAQAPFQTQPAAAAAPTLSCWCLFGPSVYVSFGVWCAFSLAQWCMAESRPELWGRYAAVLNRLQGVMWDGKVDAGAASAAAAVAEAKAAEVEAGPSGMAATAMEVDGEVLGGDLQQQHQQRRRLTAGQQHHHSQQQEQRYPQQQQMQQQQQGRQGRQQQTQTQQQQQQQPVLPVTALRLCPGHLAVLRAELLQQLGALESGRGPLERRGPADTPAGDVAFKKGKEILVSVLRRYRRRLAGGQPPAAAAAGGAGAAGAPVPAAGSGGGQGPGPGPGSRPAGSNPDPAARLSGGGGSGGGVRSAGGVGGVRGTNGSAAGRSLRAAELPRMV